MSRKPGGKNHSERRKRRVAGLALIIVGVLLAVLLAVHAWSVVRADGAPDGSAVGSVGGPIARALWGACGLISFIVPALLIAAGYGVLTRRERGRMAIEAALIVGTGALVAAFVHAVPGLAGAAGPFVGGRFGGALHALTVDLIGETPALLFLAGALLLVIVAVIDFEVPGPGPIVPLLARIARGAGALAAAAFRKPVAAPGRVAREAPPRTAAAGAATASESGASSRDDAAREHASRRRAEAGAARAPLEAAPVAARVQIVADGPPETRIVRAEKHPAAEPRATLERGATTHGATYTLPPIDLLSDPPDSGPSISKEHLLENSRTLEAKLADFGVRASVTEVHPGPVITRYELEPAPGIKVGQIANLADDLALAMRAKRIRIVAPIPGKGAVGVEIPNPEPRMVFLKEVLTSPGFAESRSPLTIAFGKDISGKAFATTLEEMPHLLIAGATGSGKSVSMHVLITSILFKALPTDVRFIMIDPKMLELAVYNDIPHLIRPVVTDPREAAKALRWVIDEMERRYKTLARVGVRNIAGFNEWLAKGADKSWGEDAAPKPLPLLVVVIDEYADLVLTLGSEVEEPIAKLAQMARAVGIHLVVATQRPSVDVITGVIKANFPSRIAFQVASKVDSRTILDINGAEKLLGKGDMLFLKTGRPEAERVHGAFISNEETTAIADFIKEQRYRVEQDLLSAEAEEDDARPFDGNAEDELFEEAVKLVVRHQFASVSMLQRRLKVGFSRAGRLMDIMERAGIVGPNEGSKAREVYIKPSEMAHADVDSDE